MMSKNGVIGILLVVGVLYGFYQSNKEETQREDLQEQIRNSTQYAQPNSIYSVPDYSGGYAPNYSGIGYDSYSNDSYSAPAPSICGVCRGGLGCQTCGGTGTYSFLGNSSDCSACNGTGDCWNCGGSGYA